MRSRRRIPGKPAHLEKWSLLVGSLLLTAPTGCEPGDRFECGIKVGANVAQCDEPNQVCVCGKRRCAHYAPGCEGTRYAFVFGDQACLEPDDVLQIRAADPSKPENALCPEVSSRPDVAESCGDFDPISGNIRNCASSSEKCVCTGDGGLCATAVGTSCPSGFSANGQCIPLSEDFFVQVLEANQRCAGAPLLDPCGVRDKAGRVRSCAAGLLCACDGDTGACAREVPFSVCSSGLQYETQDAKRCVSSGATMLQRGLCSAEPVDTVSCGVPGIDGRVGRCLTGEACACSYSGTTPQGACVRSAAAIEQAPCASDYESVSDAACLELSERFATIVLAPADVRCPVEPPLEVDCGADPAMECRGLGNLGCSCGAAPRCLVSEAGCASGMAFAGSKRCAVDVPSAQIALTVACADSGQGGAGGEGGAQ